MRWHNWFRRSKNDKSVIEEYRQATEAVSRPLAILLTLIVLFICVALIFSVFLGGRWLLHQLADNRQSAPVVVQIEASPTPNLSTDANIAITTSVPLPTPGNVSGNVRWGAEPTLMPTPIPTATPTPVTGRADNIPNTGPEPE